MPGIRFSGEAPMLGQMAETTLLTLRPTRLIALKYYIAWIFRWILSSIAFLDPTDALPDEWRLLGFRLQTCLGVLVGILGLASVLYAELDRKSTRLNSSHSQISYTVFCLTQNGEFEIVHVLVMLLELRGGPQRLDRD